MKSYQLVLALVLCGISACGEDSESSDDLARVDELSFDREEVGLTDQVVLRVSLEFGEEPVFFGDQDIAVLIRVPSELEYVEGTARVDIDGFTSRLPVDEEECSSGHSFLRLDIDRSDLSSLDESARNNADLVLTFRGYEIGPAAVAARAQYNDVVGSCSDGIVPDSTATLAVFVRGED